MFSGMNIFYMVCLYDYVEMCRYILNKYFDFNFNFLEKYWIIVYFVVGEGNNKGNEIKIFEMFLNVKKFVDFCEFIRKNNLVLIIVIKCNKYEFVVFFFERYCSLLDILNVNNLMEIGNENLNMREFLKRYLEC